MFFVFALDTDFYLCNYLDVAINISISTLFQCDYQSKSFKLATVKGMFARFFVHRGFSGLHGRIFFTTYLQSPWQTQ